MHGVFLSLSRGFAWAGGLTLVALVGVTCASVLGRAVADGLHALIAAGWFAGAAQALLDAGIGSIKGDFELIEAGVAFSIFAFLPLCQITGGHAAVDVFTTQLPARADRALRAVTDAAFAAVLVLIAVQLGVGMASKVQTGQTTFLLQFPLWWAYALSLLGAGAAALVAVYIACMRVAEAVAGRTILPVEASG